MTNLQPEWLTWVIKLCDIQIERLNKQTLIRFEFTFAMRNQSMFHWQGRTLSNWQQHDGGIHCGGGPILPLCGGELGTKMRLCPMRQRRTLLMKWKLVIVVIVTVNVTHSQGHGHGMIWQRTMGKFMMGFIDTWTHRLRRISIQTVHLCQVSLHHHESLGQCIDPNFWLWCGTGCGCHRVRCILLKPRPKPRQRPGLCCVKQTPAISNEQWTVNDSVTRPSVRKNFAVVVDESDCHCAHGFILHQFQQIMHTWMEQHSDSMPPQEARKIFAVVVEVAAHCQSLHLREMFPQITTHDTWQDGHMTRSGNVFAVRYVPEVACHCRYFHFEVSNDR